MPSIHLRFIPPDVESLAKLVIYESPSQTGTFTQIEEVTAIGSYPDYIDEYTTSLAGNVNHWFSIEWVDSKGASSGLSPPVQGNQETVVGEVVQRVMLRDASLKELVVLQETEAVVAQVFGADPYSVPITSVTYPQWRGMTNLTLAYCYLGQLVTTSTTSGASWVAGLVSMKGDSSSTGKSSKADAIDALMQKASADLGISMSRVLQMAEAAISGLLNEVNEFDQSRLLVEIL
jgi:hypothetical protein